MATRFVYVGGGRFIAGVPARDLTADEAAEYKVKDSPLYEPVSDDVLKEADRG